LYPIEDIQKRIDDLIRSLNDLKNSNGWMEVWNRLIWLYG
jgi:hypothetical protein